MSVIVSPIVRALPKVELHLHLDLSVSYHVASCLVSGLTRQAYERVIRGPARVHDLAAFLATTRAQVDLLQSRDALTLLTRDVIGTLAEERVLYAELRFAPLLHTAAGLTPEEVVETVLEAAASASDETGVGVGVLLTALRHFSRAESLRTATLTTRYHRDGVVGFDLGGDESAPLSTHLPAFDRVRAAGIPYTVHAGEGRGPDSIREVVDRLAPRRLGHGVRCVEDPDLLDRLIDEGAHFETCPTCNVQLGLYAAVDEHPVATMLARGASVSVSTDSRTSTDTSLNDELERCRNAFGWGVNELVTVSLMAAKAAFLGADARAELIDTIRAFGREHLAS
jgi:adenosine deaminase